MELIGAGLKWGQSGHRHAVQSHLGPIARFSRMSLRPGPAARDESGWGWRDYGARHLHKSSERSFTLHFFFLVWSPLPTLRFLSWMAVIHLTRHWWRQPGGFESSAHVKNIAGHNRGGRSGVEAFPWDRLPELGPFNQNMTTIVSLMHAARPPPWESSWGSHQRWRKFLFLHSFRGSLWSFGFSHFVVTKYTSCV